MKRIALQRGLAPLPVALAAASLAAAEAPVVVEGQAFETYEAYWASDVFRAVGGRCATPELDAADLAATPPSDCSLTSTTLNDAYLPGNIYEIPVVVHIIANGMGQGDLTDELVRSQIDVMNEDFQAMAGTPGAGGTDTRIAFKLATEMPDGSPTNGITRTTNATWFNDDGDYWTSLAWDPNEYLNIYTLNPKAGAALGYVPFLPQDARRGTAEDRVVILWSAFGRPAVGGGPYSQGRTATHEVGHYLGLFHTFQDGCQAEAPPNCYSSGDRICDTSPEEASVFGCPVSSESCSTPDPYHNYMDYSDDTCMTNFTPEQAQRMRCVLLNYRTTLYDTVVPISRMSWTQLRSVFGASGTSD